MLNASQFETDIIQAAEIINQTSQKILKKSRLTTSQHEDISAIHQAISKFILEAQKSKAIIISQDDLEMKKHVRHQLRNHLNIVVGFSSLIIKELPDNLLLHMISIRQICETGETLIDRVDNIQ